MNRLNCKNISWGHMLGMCLLCSSYHHSAVAQITLILGANDDSYTVNSGTETTLNVLANDVGISSIEALELDGDEVSAWIDDENNTIVLTARSDFIGSGVLYYSASGPFINGNSEASISYTVQPDLHKDYAFTKINSPVNIDVLANDKGAFIIHSAASVTGQGTVFIVPDQQSISFVSATPGKYTVRYYVDTNLEHHAEVDIYVRDPNILTQLVHDISITAVADAEPIVINLSPLSADPTISRDGTFGSTEISAQNQLRYIPEQIVYSQDHFNYIKGYANGQYGIGQVTINCRILYTDSE